MNLNGDNKYFLMFRENMRDPAKEIYISVLRVNFSFADIIYSESDDMKGLKISTKHLAKIDFTDKIKLDRLEWLSYLIQV